MRFILFGILAWMVAVSSGWAQCRGADRFAELPPEVQAALRAEAAQAPYAQGLIFRARKAEQEIVLAGTMHLPDPRHAGLLETLRPHLAKARALLVEMGPQEEAQLMSAAATDPGLMFITQGPTIPELLPEADWQALRGVLSSRGVVPFMAAKMKPFFLTVTLAVPPCTLEAMARGEEGLDKMLMMQAAAQGLPVQALEPWNTALALFDTFSAQDNMDMLQMLVRQAEDAEAQAVTLANSYFNREPRLVWEYSLHLARAQGLSAAEVQRQASLSEEVLMVRRNKAWVPVLEGAAAEGPVLAAFGALHLSGTEGVLALLEQNGWAITRLD